MSIPNLKIHVVLKISCISLQVLKQIINCNYSVKLDHLAT